MTITRLEFSGYAEAIDFLVKQGYKPYLGSVWRKGKRECAQLPRRGKVVKFYLCLAD